MFELGLELHLLSWTGLRGEGCRTSHWYVEETSCRVGKKTLWCPKWLKTSLTKWILLAWLGALPWQVSFCLTSSTQTQTGSKGVQYSGCLEGLGRHREASLKLRPRQPHIHPGWWGSSAQSQLVPGYGSQAVVDQLVVISIFNNQTTVPAHTAVLESALHMSISDEILLLRNSAYRFPKR